MSQCLCVLIILLSLCTFTHAQSRTIKLVYRTWEDPQTPMAMISTPVSFGYNTIMLSFYGPDGTIYDAAGQWAGASESAKVAAIQYAHSMGVKVMLTVRLQSQYGDWSDMNATALATAAATWARAQHLDGIDWYPFSQEVNGGFTLGNQPDSTTSINWLIALTVTTKAVMGLNCTVSHSPAANLLGPIGATNTYVGPSGGYSGVYKAIPNLIDFFGVYYMNSPGCFMDYTSTFENSGSISGCPLYASVKELNVQSAIPLQKIVVLKPTATEYALSNAGYVDPQTMHSYIYEAYQHFGWNSGVGGWSWNPNYTAQSLFIEGIYSPELPLAPSNLSIISATIGNLTIAWNYPIFDGYAPVNYTLRRGSTVIYRGTDLSFTDSGLSRAILYNYSITSTNAKGTSFLFTPFSAMSIDYPSAPSSPIPVSLNSTSITISWSAPSYNGFSPVTSYVVLRNGVTLYSGPALQYTDSGLQPGGTYTYTVMALNAAGVSYPSLNTTLSTNITIPNPPSSFQILSSTVTSVQLEWSPPLFNGGANITKYLVQRTSSAGSNTFDLGLSLTFTDAGLSPTTQYSYSVTAMNAAGTSASSVLIPFLTGALAVACSGSNMVVGSSGACECASGYTSVGGGACQNVGVIVAATIVPVVFVLGVGFLIFFFFKRRGQVENKKILLSRSPTLTKEKTMRDLPELQNAYMSSNLITDYEELEVTSKLGTGGSGVVYVGKWRNTEVAIKEYRDQNIQTTDFIRESEIHAKLRHPNVVQLLAICLPPHLCAVSEFMARGSLADVLEKKPPELTWIFKCQMVLDIARGMDYLHKSRIIHRDLKSQNCLVDKNWNCKIADFGTSKFLVEDATATVYVPRTAQWTAPEVITQNNYSEKSDVYSFGIILWEVLTGRLPYDGMFAYQVEDRTVHGHRLTVPEGTDSWYEVLMRECWHATPAERPSFEQIIACLQTVMTKPPPPAADETPNIMT